MGLEALVALIVNNGVAVMVVAYFLWKDSKLTKENTEALQQNKQLLTMLSERLDRLFGKEAHEDDLLR